MVREQEQSLGTSGRVNRCRGEADEDGVRREGEGGGDSHETSRGVPEVRLSWRWRRRGIRCVGAHFLFFALSLLRMREPSPPKKKPAECGSALCVGQSCRRTVGLCVAHWACAGRGGGGGAEGKVGGAGKRGRAR